MMLPEISKPSIRIVFTTEFGDVTDITKSLSEGTIGEIFEAVRECLAGCGFQPGNIDEWFPEE